ncbi:MAG: hypothetical protein ACRDQB_07790 [Thermocrispum sp.]
MHALVRKRTVLAVPLLALAFVGIPLAFAGIALAGLDVAQLGDGRAAQLPPLKPRARG